MPVPRVVGLHHRFKTDDLGPPRSIEYVVRLEVYRRHTSQGQPKPWSTCSSNNPTRDLWVAVNASTPAWLSTPLTSCARQSCPGCARQHSVSTLRSANSYFGCCVGVITREGTLPPSAEKLTGAPSILHRAASLTTDKSVTFWSSPTGTGNEVVLKAHRMPRYRCILDGFTSHWFPTASSCKIK